MIDLRDCRHSLDVLVEILQASGFDIEGCVSLTAEPSFAEHDTGVLQDDAAPRTHILLEFSGSDTELLLERNGEVLLAIEEVAAQMLDLQPNERDLLSVDAANFKAEREHKLSEAAEVAISEVRSSLTPFVFPPMTSRERRMLHLALARSGLKSASTGETPRRAVVLYPAGMVPPEDRTRNPRGRPTR